MICDCALCQSQGLQQNYGLSQIDGMEKYVLRQSISDALREIDLSSNWDEARAPLVHILKYLLGDRP
jgi:hypothetical protein